LKEEFRVVYNSRRISFSPIVHDSLCLLYSRGPWFLEAFVADTFAPAPPSLAILIVDDNPNVTQALSTLVRNAGYETIGCTLGRDALERTVAFTPAAAVIDVHLPDINGLILVQKLRERFGPATPIIVVSGDTSMETLKSLQHVGATYFFSKPVNSGMLIERLKTLIKGCGD
jgi:DNA-binding response OmpR family regulator